MMEYRFLDTVLENCDALSAAALLIDGPLLVNNINQAKNLS